MKQPDCLLKIHQAMEETVYSGELNKQINVIVQAEWTSEYILNK